MTTCIMPSRDDREWIVRGGGNGMPLILKRRLRHHPCAGVLAPGHPSDRRRGTLGKISRKGGRRPSRVTRSAFAGDLARLHTGAPGGCPAFAVRAPGADRCGARPVRRAAGTACAPTPPWPGGPKSGKRRPGAQRLPERPAGVIGGSSAASGLASSSRGADPKAVASRVRRAPRALDG